MNVERILALADLIEKQPHTDLTDGEGFNMSNWSHDCGTPSCIAGWAIAMNRNDLRVRLPKAGVDFNPTSEARSYLGIGYAEADELFEPTHGSWKNITPTQAAATLRHLAATCEVDWCAKATGSALDAGNAA